jgi:hypothetical protein
MNDLARRLAGALDPVAFGRELGMTLYPWQEAAVRSEAPRVLWLAHRQGGKTTASSLLALHAALFRPGSTVVVVSVALRQAQLQLRQAIAWYRRLSRPVAAEAESKLTLELEGGSRIIAVPGDSATIRGYAADLLIVDEAAHVPSETFEAALPMVSATGGRVLALTTPAGRLGWFYDLWTEGGGRWERRRVSTVESMTVRPSLRTEIDSGYLDRGPSYVEREFMVERRPDGTWRDVPEPFAAATEGTFGADYVAAAFTDDIAPLLGGSHA